MVEDDNIKYVKLNKIEDSVLEIVNSNLSTDLKIKFLRNFNITKLTDAELKQLIEKKLYGYIFSMNYQNHK